MPIDIQYASAIEDFHSARSKAAMQQVLARLTGRSTKLLSFDEVREKLKVEGSVDKGLQEIPIENIAGSVGRYSDFTRDFLPINAADAQRWARVLVAATDMKGLPPIEVYKVGDSYFVKDGNHRVSVARRLGATFIQAYVTELRTKVPLDIDSDLDETIIRSEYEEFLEKTRLEDLRPGSDIVLTAPGKYPLLLEHIAVHRYYMGIEQQREISFQEAAAHWYDTVYRPVAEIIRERGVMRYFPSRTDADLYLWIAEHRAQLREEMGWDIATKEAAGDLVERYGESGAPLLVKLGERVRDALSPDILKSGPPPGAWRAEREVEGRKNKLFSDILVAISGSEHGWSALEQALVIAKREQARVHGLHVLMDGDWEEEQVKDLLRKEFDRRVGAADVPATLAFVQGQIASELCSRSHWSDLIVAPLRYPPPEQPLARMSSGIRDLIYRCPRPLVTTPGEATPMDHALLAYDGSPKGHEALYMAAYLGSKWGIPLRVISVISGSVTEDTLNEAREYLDKCGASVEYIAAEPPVTSAILHAARGCDFIIMGGYGTSPVIEVVLGSVVGEVLREAHQPLILCR